MTRVNFVFSLRGRRFERMTYGMIVVEDDRWRNKRFRIGDVFPCWDIDWTVIGFGWDGTHELTVHLGSFADWIQKAEFRP